MPNKKSGQMGETITWVVATVVIIVILLISIFISTSYLGGQKTVSFSKTNDVLASKSFFAYLLTEDGGGQTVYNQLKNEENLNDFNGNLALNIFEEFYGEEYIGDLWVGIVPPTEELFIKNNYFGSDSSIIGGVTSSSMMTTVSHAYQIIQLDENKFVKLVLNYE